MGLVVVISLPLILFCLLLGFGCYFIGRAKGRQDIRTNAQVFGVPTPPPGSAAAHSPPPPPLFKLDNSANVWLVIRSKFNSSLYCNCVNSVLSVKLPYSMNHVSVFVCPTSFCAFNQMNSPWKYLLDYCSTLLQLPCLTLECSLKGNPIIYMTSI